MIRAGPQPVETLIRACEIAWKIEKFCRAPPGQRHFFQYHQWGWGQDLLKE